MSTHFLPYNGQVKSDFFHQWFFGNNYDQIAVLILFWENGMMRQGRPVAEGVGRDRTLEKPRTKVKV